MLSCLNCKKDVPPDDAKIFAEVFLCPDCFTVAERFLARGEHELRMMLVVLKEAIRVAALKGELQFSTEKLEDVPKEEILTKLQGLAALARKNAEG